MESNHDPFSSPFWQESMATYHQELHSLTYIIRVVKYLVLQKDNCPRISTRYSFGKFRVTHKKFRVQSNIFYEDEAIEPPPMFL
jgi:hypothetical protein